MVAIAPENGAVFRPRSLSEALGLRASIRDAAPIHGGTDLMVGINAGRSRPGAFIDLSRVEALRGLSVGADSVKIGAGVTYTQLMAEPIATALPALAEASRTVGSPQIRNRGTVGGNLGTASPAGDSLPPLVAAGAQVELVRADGVRVVPIHEFLLGPKQNALAPDELIAAVLVPRRAGTATFMKVGPRNAMVIAIASLALQVDLDQNEIRAAYGSAGPVVSVVTAPLGAHADLPERVAEACSPIDDVRGSAAYRRQALRVLVGRALERCLA